MFGERFLLGLLIAGLLLAVAHWFPWPKGLHQLVAYVIGVAAILTGAGIWLLPAGYGWVWLGLASFAVVSGAVTGICWGIDALLKLWVKSQTGES